ncbi:MAG: MotE family protein [Sulfitobacter sp.]
MSVLSFPKLVVFGLGTALVMKLAVDVIPMTANAEPITDTKPSSAQTAAAPEFIPIDPATEMCEPSHVLAEAIAEERSLLSGQREAVADREARLALAEQSLKAEQARLAKLRDDIGAQLALIEDANSQDMTKLVELYRNMKPQVAAGIMDEIDIETAVQVIGAMAERDAAQIMGAFSLVRARAITKILLERSKLPADRNLDGLRLH